MNGRQYPVPSELYPHSQYPEVPSLAVQSAFDVHFIGRVLFD